MAGCRRVLRPKAAPNSDTYAPFTHNLLFPKGRVPAPPPFTLEIWKRSALHVAGRREAGDGFGNSRLSLLPRTDRRAATSCPRYPEDSELAPPPTHRLPRAGASRGRRWGDYVTRARTIDLFAVESKSENTAGRHSRTQHGRLPGRGHSKGSTPRNERNRPGLAALPPPQKCQSPRTFSSRRALGALLVHDSKPVQGPSDKPFIRRGAPLSDQSKDGQRNFSKPEVDSSLD